MSIDGMSVLNAATSMSVTGGTATTFEVDGTPVATGVRVSDTVETDLRLKKHFTFKRNAAKLQSNGTFSKEKRSVVLTIPAELADGSISYQVARVEFEYHPEFSAVAADLLNLRLLAAQAITDAELDNFYQHGSTR